MNYTKILFGLAFIAFCCITFGESLKCYTCGSKKECGKKVKKYDCNQNLANQTRIYVDFHHKGVNTNLTSPYYNCFSEKLKTVNGEFQHKGCIYNNMPACDYPLHDKHTQGNSKVDRRCSICNDKDGCNPAGRASSSISVLTMCATALMVAAVGKYAWYN